MRAARTRWLAGVVVGVLVVGCDRGPLADRATRKHRVLGAGRPPSNVRPAPALPVHFGVGHPATAADIAAWDVDVTPDGHGLSAGSGTPAQGADVFAAKCAACHGPRGEGQVGAPPAGVPPAPKLIGRDPRDGFPFGQDPKLVKTVGNYWPYATTVFDYIRRAMPPDAPGSLSDADVYNLTAFLLNANELIPSDAVVDAASLPKVVMPAKSHFVPDTRRR